MPSGVRKPQHHLAESFSLSAKWRWELLLEVDVRRHDTGSLARLVLNSELDGGPPNICPSITNEHDFMWNKRSLQMLMILKAV